MGKQRMRYQWFRDIPRNVSRREYEQYQWRLFAAGGLGSIAAVMAIAATFNLPMQPLQEVAAIDSMSIPEAAAYRGDRLPLLKLEGYLVADDAPTMPDDPARKVIRGSLEVSARAGSSTGTAEGEAPPRETLFAWEGAAQSVFLSDGETRIPLAFDLAVLPLVDESHSATPHIVRQGNSTRTSRPVAVEYRDEVFPLTPETWERVDSVIPEVKRQVLPHGQSVVVVASLAVTPQGVELVDPLGDRLHVLLGTEQDMRQQGQQVRRLFALLCLPLGFLSYWIGRSALHLRQDFVARSNQG